MTLEAIRYSRCSLQVLDQLKLPSQTEYVKVETPEDGYSAIFNMVVRGAPAIAIVAALSLAVQLHSRREEISKQAASEVKLFIDTKLDYLNRSRPTAVNLSDAIRKLKAAVAAEVGKPKATAAGVAELYISQAEAMLQKDVEDNMNIGRLGAEWLSKTIEGKEKISVITHCNTGSLATAGYGTALGIIRSLWSSGKLSHAYCTETRPYNQGSRLTAYELVHDNIPATLITDSMAAAVMKLKGVSAVIVGADRVVRNGDTANKIGTYQLAILAKHHGIKFVVAAPTTSIDTDSASGEDIVIEQRPWHEVMKVTGPRVNEIDNTHSQLNLDRDHITTVCTAAQGINVFNPAFDVTPAALIDAIVTEKAVIVKDSVGKFQLHDAFNQRKN